MTDEYSHWNLAGQAEILSLESATRRINDWRAGLQFLPPAVVVTSCPADPLHSGHITALQDSLPKAHGEILKAAHEHLFAGSFLFVVVNDDDFLVRKKGMAFMPHKVRCQMISALRGVDFVIPFTPTDPVDMTVCEAILALSPDFFTKGGDRTDPKTIPEWETCEDVGAKIITGCGDNKTWSSSSFLERWSTAAYWRGFKDGRGK